MKTDVAKWFKQHKADMKSAAYKNSSNNNDNITPRLSFDSVLSTHEKKNLKCVIDLNG